MTNENTGDQAPAPNPMEAAVARLKEMRGEVPPAPETPEPEAPEPEAPETPEPEEPEDGLPPSLSDLESVLLKRQETRRKEQEQKSRDDELERLREEKKAWEAKNTEFSVEDFRRLKPEQQKLLLQTLTKSVLNPENFELEQRLEQIERGRSEPSELEKRLQNLEAREQAQKRHEAETRYLGVAQNPEKYPMLSRLTPQEAISWGDRVYDTYYQAGHTLTFDQAAGIIERELTAQYERLSGGVPAGGTPPGDEDNTAAGSGSVQKKRRTSISNDLISQSNASKPQTHEDRLQLAVKKLRTMRSDG